MANQFKSVRPEETTQDSYPWLIRTAKNQIIGPLSRQMLCEKIKKGDFNLQDEVCPANGYWMFLHESEEVSRNLGIVPRPLDQEDTTDTETETSTRTLPVVPVPTLVTQKNSHAKTPESSSSQNFSEAAQASVPKETIPQRSYRPSLAEVEGPSILKMVLFVLVLGIVIGLILVVRLTRQHSG